MTNTKDINSTKLTRTHAAYFEQYVEDLFRRALTEVSEVDANVNAMLALIDFKEYGKRFGEEVFKHCSYQDLKYAEKALADERVIRATEAINQAVANIKVSKDDGINHEVDARFIISGAFSQSDMVDALSESSQEVQAKAIEILLTQAAE